MKVLCQLWHYLSLGFREEIGGQMNSLHTLTLRKRLVSFADQHCSGISTAAGKQYFHPACKYEKGTFLSFSLEIWNMHALFMCSLNVDGVQVETGSASKTELLLLLSAIAHILKCRGGSLLKVMLNVTSLKSRSDHDQRLPCLQIRAQILVIRRNWIWGRSPVNHMPQNQSP